MMMMRTLVSILLLSATNILVYSWTAHQSHLHGGYTGNAPRTSDFSGQPFIFNGTVTILDKGENHVVVSKPPAVLCHRSGWSGGSKSSKTKSLPEIPMLQRAREAVGERVNLIHRLDRGASGCLLMSLAKADQDDGNTTAILQENMSLSTSHKTYIALVRGEGILKERTFKNEGWFEVDKPVKNERGNLKNATSYFRFIAGQGNENGLQDRPRASLVLARIKTGRWHQIRLHLRSLSHPIIGDSTHGNSKTNREWKQKWGLQPERTCLHLLKLELSPTSVTPNGICVSDALPRDMMDMLQKHFSPEFWDEAESALKEEGLSLTPEGNPNNVAVNIGMTECPDYK